MMDQTQNETQKAEAEANARLQELEAEIAGLPTLIKAAEKKARSARDYETVDKCLEEKQQLEKRLRALPYLIPQARISVLRARAESVGAIAGQAGAELPGAQAELKAAESQLAEATQRFQEAEQAVKLLIRRKSSADHKRDMLLLDADNLSQGKPTLQYFKN